MTNFQSSIATLTYDAAREFLWGSVGVCTFHIKAYSGGGRGSIHPKKWDRSLRSYLANTKKAERQRGGTIPNGHYVCHYMRNHPTYHECVRLDRCSDAIGIASPFSARPIPHLRDNDFFIHGRGELGSDGCIVPENHAIRLELNKAIKQFNGTVYVHVIGTAYALPAERVDGVFS